MASSSAAHMSDIDRPRDVASSPQQRRRGNGNDEAEEDGNAEGGAGARKKGARRGKGARRDVENIPAVRDDTGEEVMRLFESFLEELSILFPSAFFCV